jgi:hypothetical protein
MEHFPIPPFLLTRFSHSVDTLAVMILPFLFAAAVASGAPEKAKAQTPASIAPRALRVVEGKRATRMGPDHLGNLFIWEQRAQLVTMLAPSGEIVAKATVEHASAVDGDVEWGVAALSDHDASLSIIPFRAGQKASTIPLETKAFSVCWMSGHEVAVSPKLGGFRVEVWDVTKGVRTRTLGPEPPVVPKPGQYRARGVLLAFDHRNQRLLSLDAFTGELVVFSSDGATVRRAGVRHPDWERLSAQFDHPQGGASAGEGQSEIVVSPWDSLAVDEAGNAWLAEGAGPRDVKFVKFQKDDDAIQRFQQDGLECVSLRFTLWGGWLLTYRDPLMPMAVCSGTRRVQ